MKDMYGAILITMQRGLNLIRNNLSCSPRNVKKREDRKLDPEKWRNISNEQSRKWRQADPARSCAKTRKWCRENQHKYLWQIAKQRAKRKNLDFTITFDDIVIPETCPVLGVKLESGLGKGFTDYAPSIDRIDSSKGYLPNNILVISRKANMIKSYSTPEELRAVADFYSKFEGA